MVDEKNLVKFRELASKSDKSLLCMGQVPPSFSAIQSATILPDFRPLMHQMLFNFIGLFRKFKTKLTILSSRRTPSSREKSWMYP